MDWDDPNGQQVFALVWTIEECFPNNSDLQSFLNEQGVVFPKVAVRKGNTYREALSDFITVAVRKRFLGQLLEVLKRRPLFADVFKRMEIKLEEYGHEKEKEVVSVPNSDACSEGLPDKESSRVGVVTEPTGPDEKQLEVMINDIIERFDNLLHFCMYLIGQKVDFPLPPMDFDPKIFEKHLRAYVKEAVQWGWATKLYEKWKEMSPYVVPLEEYLHPEPNWDDLSGKQLKVIRDAIEKAFPNPKDFDLFLSDTFDKGPLSNHSAAGGFAQQLYDFLRDVRAAGWAKDLVIALEATKRLPVRNLAEALTKL